MGIVESWTNFERHCGETIGAREQFEVFYEELLDLEILTWRYIRLPLTQR